MRRISPVTASDLNSDEDLSLTNLSVKEKIPRIVTRDDTRSAELNIGIRLMESSNAIERRLQFRGRFFRRENGRALRLAGVRIGIPSLDFFSPSISGFLAAFAGNSVLIGSLILLGLLIPSAISSIIVITSCLVINPLVVTMGPLLLSRAILFTNALKIKRSLGEVATQRMEARVAAEELELDRRFPESSIRLPEVSINKIFSTKKTRLKYIYPKMERLFILIQEYKKSLMIF